MPAVPRRELVREGEVAVYHVWTRTAQQEFLLRSPDDERRVIVRALLIYLATLFAIDIGTYVILENHLHLILRTRPDLVANWTSEMVAWRWKMLWAQWDGERWGRSPTDAEVRALVGNPEKLAMARKALSSLSWFMARLKEPLAKLFNAESGKQGHYWEGRFKCREVDEAGAVTGFVYADLNLLKAGMADSLETSNFSGIQDRIVAHQAGRLLEQLLASDPDAPIDAEVMEQLARDCFLSPITTDAPLLVDPYGRPLSSRGDGDRGELPATIVPAAVVTAEPPTAGAEQPVVESVVKQGDERPVRRAIDLAADADGGAGDAPATVEAGTDVVPRSGSGAAEVELGERDGEVAAKAAAESASVGRLEPSGVSEPTRAEGSGVREPGSVERLRAGGTASTSGAAASSRRRRRGRPAVVKPKKTWTIHERMRREQRRRASENCILRMPLEQYLALVHWAASRLGHGPGPPEQPPDELAAALRALGIVPEKWLEAVRNFHQLFRRAAGRAETLARHAAHGGRRWLHGQRNCADHFT